MQRTNLCAPIIAISLILFWSCQANTSSPSDKSKGTSDHQNGEVIELTGTVALVGSEPFTSLAVRTNTTTWIVQKESEGIIKNFETQTVHVRGKIFVRQMTLANGKKLQPQYELYDLELIQ